MVVQRQVGQVQRAGRRTAAGGDGHVHVVQIRADAGTDEDAAAQVRHLEVRVAVAAVQGADDREQRLVLLHGQILTPALDGALRGEGAGERENQAEISFHDETSNVFKAD